MRKFRFIFGMFLALACTWYFFSASGTAKGQENIKVVCNNQILSFDAEPRLMNGRVYVPFRFLFEALGAEVVWDEKKRTINASAAEGNLVINLNSGKARLNGNQVPIPEKPIVEKGRVLVPLRFVSEALNSLVTWDGQNKTVYIEKNKLPVVGTYENLKKLLESSPIAQRNMVGDMAKSGEMSTTARIADGAGGQGESADYSTTNVQVQGVDEGDIVKTDGKYIYQVNNNRIVIMLAEPAEEMAVTRVINFAQGNFYPRELYVDKKHLVVIGSSYETRILNRPFISSEIKIYPPVRGINSTQAMIYDITDKNNIKQIREVELEGNYLSSRKVGSLLYLTANKYLDYYHIMKEEAAAAPFYRDTGIKDDYISIPYREICYFPGRPEPNYLLAAGLDLEKPDQEMKVSAYLGAGENIYATEKSLYAAITGYQYREDNRPLNVHTRIYKFTLGQGEITFKAQGEVPGTILNQFSMDEHQGFFRIATTTGDMWREDEYTSKNNIYILNENMKTAGKITDIAPGERIYSVRFMGDRGYMVTFKNVDPLFVIDLKDPYNPTILGALKIPGYSDYLHPFDENHIIGFGKDTVEISQKDWQGKEIGTMAFYQGLKIALFDVRDVANPVQKFQEIIGDRGTDSELLRNHRALLFSREKNLMAFPITVMEVKNKDSMENNFPPYGEFAFQGAYVYRLDLTNGFKLKGTITHLEGEDQIKAGYDWYSSNKNVERILYIGDTLYTLSKEMVRANKVDTLSHVNSIIIPQ